MEAVIQHNYDDAMVVVGVGHQLFMQDNAHIHNHMTTIAIEDVYESGVDYCL